MRDNIKRVQRESIDLKAGALTTSQVSANISNVIHQLTLIQRDHSIERSKFEKIIRDQDTHIRNLESQLAVSK